MATDYIDNIVIFVLRELGRKYYFLVPALVLCEADARRMSSHKSVILGDKIYVNSFLSS